MITEQLVMNVTERFERAKSVDNSLKKKTCLFKSFQIFC